MGFLVITFRCMRILSFYSHYVGTQDEIIIFSGSSPFQPGRVAQIAGKDNEDLSDWARCPKKA
jgi:hypothetical protein